MYGSEKITNTLNTYNIPFFFIIGRPRSGTTLLRMLLEAHPNVVIPPESPLILSLYKKYRKKTGWSREDMEGLFRDIRKQRYFESWLMDETALRREMMTMTGENTFRNILKKVYLSYASLYPKDDIRLIGDKNPGYSLYIKRLHKLFPDSKFIYIARDYRDNYLSLTRVNFEVPVIPLVVYRWKFAYRQFRTLQQKHPSSFYYLKYEDLAAKPEAQFQRICEFLGIEFRKDVFGFYKKEVELKEAYGHSEELLNIHRSLLKPVNTGRIGIWKGKMSEKQVRKADLVAGKAAEQAGYERKYRGFSPFLYMWVMPVLVYARFMYALMLWGERLPYKVRNSLLEVLGIFLKAYWAMNKKKLKQGKA